MERLIEQLRLTEDPADLERAEMIAQMLARRGSDLPLGQTDINSTSVYGHAHVPLVLADADSALLTEGPEETVQKQEIIAYRTAQMQGVVEPYAHLFDSHLPTPKVHERRMFVNRAVPGKSKVESWGHKVTRPGITLKYSYSLSAKSDNEGFCPQDLWLWASSQHDSKHPPVTVRLGFFENEINIVTLSLGETNSRETFNKLSKGTYLSEFMQEFVGPTAPSSKVDLRYSIAPAGPIVDLSNGFGMLPEHPDYLYLKSVFILKRDGNFDRQMGDPRQHKKAAEKHGVSLREDLDFDRALNVLKDILRLIPTVSEDQISDTNS